jgi:hypothetical protein
MAELIGAAVLLKSAAVPMIAAATGAATMLIGSFVIYKLLPGTYNLSASYFNTSSYKTDIITMGQNSKTACGLLKFLSGFSGYDGVTTVRVMIDEKRYKIPLNLIYFKDPNSKYHYYLKVNVDKDGNVSNVIASTYKLRWDGRTSWFGIFTGWSENNDRLEAFDNFLNKYSD